MYDRLASRSRPFVGKTRHCSVCIGVIGRTSCSRPCMNRQVFGNRTPRNNTRSSSYNTRNVLHLHMGPQPVRATTGGYTGAPVRRTIKTKHGSFLSTRHAESAPYTLFGRGACYGELPSLVCATTDCCNSVLSICKSWDNLGCYEVRVFFQRAGSHGVCCKLLTMMMGPHSLWQIGGATHKYITMNSHIRTWRFVEQIEISNVGESSKADAPNTIQMAIDMAEPGDTILLAPGMVSKGQANESKRAATVCVDVLSIQAYSLCPFQSLLYECLHTSRQVLKHRHLPIHG